MTRTKPHLSPKVLAVTHRTNDALDQTKPWASPELSKRWQDL